MMNILPIFNIYVQLLQQLLNILSDKHNTICLTFRVLVSIFHYSKLYHEEHSLPFITFP